MVRATSSCRQSSMSESSQWDGGGRGGECGVESCDAAEKRLRLRQWEDMVEGYEEEGVAAVSRVAYAAAMMIVPVPMLILYRCVD